MTDVEFRSIQSMFRRPVMPTGRDHRILEWAGVDMVTVDLTDGEIQSMPMIKAEARAKARGCLGPDGITDTTKNGVSYRWTRPAATLRMIGSRSINCPAPRSGHLTEAPNTATDPTTGAHIRRFSAVQSDIRAAILKYDDGSEGCECVSISLTRIGTDSTVGQGSET